MAGMLRWLIFDRLILTITMAAMSERLGNSALAALDYGLLVTFIAGDACRY